MSTLLTSARPSPATELKGAIGRHPLLAFFVLAFGITCMTG